MLRQVVIEACILSLGWVVKREIRPELVRLAERVQLDLLEACADSSPYVCLGLAGFIP